MHRHNGLHIYSGDLCIGGFDDFCDHEMITLITSDGHAVCGSPGNGGDATPNRFEVTEVVAEV